MNALRVLAVPDGRHYMTGEQTYRFRWIVDGVDLIEQLRQDIPVEVQHEAAAFRAARGLKPREDGEPDFQGVREEVCTGPNGMAWVDAAREPGPVALVADCTCGQWECSAVVADVERRDGVVAWLNVRPGNGAKHPPRGLRAPGVPDLHFDADQYDRAFREPVRLPAE